jgi:hypothetical protein
MLQDSKGGDDMADKQATMRLRSKRGPGINLVALGIYFETDTVEVERTLALRAVKEAPDYVELADAQAEAKAEAKSEAKPKADT